jgi:hypothetical protein
MVSPFMGAPLSECTVNWPGRMRCRAQMRLHAVHIASPVAQLAQRLRGSCAYLLAQRQLERDQAQWPVVALGARAGLAELVAA